MPTNPGERARDAYEKAKAAAAPTVARAQAEAAPHVQNAAKRAGSLFGQLRDQARKTARGFSEAYSGEDETSTADAPKVSPDVPTTARDAQPPRPRPGPGRR